MAPPLLLPSHAIPLLSPLSLDDREVLSYLLLLGLHFLPPSSPSPSDKPLWKPWKHGVSSSSSSRKSLPPNFSFRAPPCEKGSSCPDLVCDCFSCYSRFWSRWNASPNRDIINSILEIVEAQEKLEDLANSRSSSCCGKKNSVLEGGGKKSKKRIVKKKGDDNALQAVKNEQESCKVPRGQDMVDSSLMCAAAEDQKPGGTAKQVVSKRKGKSLKNKVSSKEPDVSKEGETNGSIILLPTMESIKEGETNGSIILSVATASVQGKNGPRHQRGKRKNNQVIPLDCESPDKEMGDQQEFGAAAAPSVDDEISENSISLRVTDSNLRGRGFFAHVFIGSLGGVASRLWDLVSLGFGNRSIDYY